MAEQRSKRSQNGSSRSSQGLSGREAIERVRGELPELLGHPVDAVLGVEPGEKKGWQQVTVQVVELARIPNSTDVLGAYEVTLDQHGELQAYKRRRRYYRAQADED